MTDEEKEILGDRVMSLVESIGMVPQVNPSSSIIIEILPVRSGDGRYDVFIDLELLDGKREVFLLGGR